MSEQGDMKKEVWGALEKVEDLSQLDEKERQYLQELVDQIIKDGEEEIRKFTWVPEHVEPEKEEGVFRSIESKLTPWEILLLKYALHLETFTLTLELSAVPKIAKFTRGGKEFFEDIDLSTRDGIARATRMQIVSILVELIILLLSAAGIKISYTKEQMESVIAIVSQLIDETVVQKVQDFITAWQRATSLFDKAKLVVSLITSLFKFSPLFLLKIVKALVSPLPILQRLLLIAKIAVAIRNAWTNPGKLRAEIAQALKQVPDIIEKKVLNVAALKKLAK